MITSEPNIRPGSDAAAAFAREIPTPSSDRFGRAAFAPPSGASTEDVLVVDDRSHLSPAEAVENRLSRILSDASLPVSHLQMRGMLRSR